jgi:hypothetical protein
VFQVAALEMTAAALEPGNCYSVELIARPVSIQRITARVGGRKARHFAEQDYAFLDGLIIGLTQLGVWH